MIMKVQVLINFRKQCRREFREKLRDGRFMLIDEGKVPSGVFLTGF